MAEPGLRRVTDWLLVPGWGFDASAFDEVRAALPPAFAVEAVACSAAAAAIDRRVAAVHAGEGAPFGIGAWSLGATIALERASRCRGAIAALVVTGATPRFVACDGWPHAMPAADFDAFAAIAAASPVGAQSRLAALCALGASDAPALVRRLRRSFDRPRPDDGPGAFDRALLRDLESLRNADLRGLLPGIDLPVTVVHGERDALVPADAARMMVDLLPRATGSTVPGAGHALPVTCAAQFAATIARAAGSPIHATAQRAEPDADVIRPR